MMLSLIILLLIFLVIGVYLITNKTGLYPKRLGISIGIFKLEIESEEKHTKIQQSKKPGM